MVFRKPNMRQIVVALIVVVIIGCILIGKVAHKDMDTSTQLAGTGDIDDTRGTIKSEGLDLKTVESPKPGVLDDSDEILKRMADQMEKDREQQRQIKDLKMQREKTDLELEEQKALSELNKLKNDSIGSVNEGNITDASNMDIKIVYLGGTDAQKEAILSINGTNYSVKEKDRPLKNFEVLSITNNDVTVHFLTPEDIRTTYQFRSE